MLYQRKHEVLDSTKQPQTQNQNNEKKIISTTTIKKISTEKQPIIKTSKPYNLSTNLIEKTETQINERVITETSLMKSEIESSSSMDKKNSKFRVYLSSRYKGLPSQINSELKGQSSSMMDIQNNIHTLNARKSPDNNISRRNIIEKTGEIKKMNYSQYSREPLIHLTYKKSDFNNENLKSNQKETTIVKISPNNKRFKQQMIPQNIMSPIKHYDDGNSLFDNKKFSEKKTSTTTTNVIVTNYNNTNSKMPNKKLSTPNTNINRGTRSLFQEISKDKQLGERNSSFYNNRRDNSQGSNTVSYKELKKIVKKFNKVYDPYTNQKGLLIKKSQVTLPGASDEVFTNRYRVLSKMNKLSNILLAKQKKLEEDNIYFRDNSKERNIYEKGRNISNRQDSKNKNSKKDKKLLLFSLTMISSKNLNNKDKIILRYMRNDKGGVVDLAQDKGKKGKFKIKKATKVGGERKIIRASQKEKERAAKTIQSWWKELKDIYNYKLAQIIKIQSIWKGRWVRKNIYDLLYLNFLYLSFCQKIEKVVTNKMTRYAFNKLFNYKKNNNNNINNNNTNYNNINNINNNNINNNNYNNIDNNNYNNKSYSNFKNKYSNRNEVEKKTKEEINLNGKKVIKITTIKESERYISSGLKDKNQGKNKFKGLLQILEGVNKYHKKQAFEVTKPKIKKYLSLLAKKEKLKNIIEKKNRNVQYILKKVIYKWLTKATNKFYFSKNQTEKEKIFYSNIKGKLFFRRIENIKNKQRNILLRKYFYRYLKNVLLLAKKEERQKLLDVYKNDEPDYSKYDKYNTIIKHKHNKSFSQSTYTKNKNIHLRILYNVGDNLEACKILERYTRRRTHVDILNCFKNKVTKKLLIERLIKIIKIKEKIQRTIIRFYLNKWKNNTFKKQRDDLITKMFIKIIKIIIENKQKKLLSKKLYQWRRIVNILNGKKDIFLKSKSIYNFFNQIKKLINKKYATFFMNRIKLLKNKRFSISILKKIIIRQNIKNKYILLKNAINRWRNKVADYEIGKLKGKLLLKIYDKYKVNKRKDLIRKKIFKWENNTIFIDRIKKRINTENIDTFTKRNNSNKIIIILKSIIRNNNRKNNELKLRKYFNRWEKNTREKKVQFTSLQIKDNERKTSLKNILIKYGKLRTKDKIKRYYFARWLYINKSLKQTEFANVIQNFCHVRLKNKLIINKWIKLYKLLKNKRRKNNIKNILKIIKKYISIQKLIKALKRKNKFKSFFLNRLSFFLKKKISPNHILKKIIIRQNIKKKHILLKNAINRWKNKVSDYEIGKLKGKLLLKIYDKYKINRIKDLIKKKLYKWENNTIFIDRIKNRINTENINTYTSKNTKTKIVISLKSLIRNVNRKKNYVKLRWYFNKWKNILQKKIKPKNYNYLDVSTIHLTKFNKIKNGKYFLDKLKDNKKNIILKKVILKYARPKKEKLNFFFKRWLYINKKLKQIDYANIIQEYCKNKLRNLTTINKWKKLYKLLKNKKRKNDIRYITEILKIFSSIKKIIKVINDNRSKFYKKILSFFFSKITNMQKEIKTIPNNLLRKIIIRRNNKISQNLLKNALNRWRNKVADYEIEKLKGKLLLKIYDKYKTNKIKDLLKKKLNKWENHTIFVDRIKNRINKENIDRFTEIYIKDKIIIIFKSLFRNINRKFNDIILRKYLNRWKKTINNDNKSLDYAGKNLLKIIKKGNARYFINKLKVGLKDKKLKNLIIKYNRPKDKEILHYYFSKWLYFNKKLNQIENANIIQKFCLIKLRNKRNVNNWRKLFFLLKNKNRKNNIKDILNSLKYYISLTKLTKALKNKNKKNIFDTLKRRIDTETTTVILIEVFENFEKKKDNNLLKRFFTKWKNLIRKKNHKDEALKNMMNVLGKKQTKNSVNFISDVSMISKFLKDIPKARAINFLQKIKKQGRYNNLYKILSYDLVDTRDDLQKNNKKPIIDKILKMYAYKVLSNLFDKLDKIDKNKNVIIMEDFFSKLYNINIKKAKYNYMKENILEREPNIEKGIRFKSKTKPKAKRDENKNKTIIYKQLTPSLVKYINRRFLNRKEDAFDGIKYNTNGNKFCKLLKKFVKNTNIPDKEDLVDSLKYYVYIKITKGRSSNKFYNLIRKAIIRKILNISKTIGNLTRILHLVKITITHRKISKDRFLLNLIKRWRFITFVKKMALKKMEIMYKDLHTNYLEMADVILNEDSPMGPYDRRFLPDIKNDKFLFDFNDPLLLKGANPYEGTKLKYEFKPLNVEMEKRIKVIQEVETIDKTREINRNYYINDDDDNNINKELGKIKGSNINRVIEERKYNKNIETEPNIEQGRRTININGEAKGKGTKKEEKRYSYQKEIFDSSKGEGIGSKREEGRFSLNGQEKNYDNIEGYTKIERRKYVIDGGKELDNNPNDYEGEEYEYGYDLEGKNYGKNKYGSRDGYGFKGENMYESSNIRSDNRKDLNDFNNKSNERTYYYSERSIYKGNDFKKDKKEEKL